MSKFEFLAVERLSAPLLVLEESVFAELISLRMLLLFMLRFYVLDLYAIVGGQTNVTIKSRGAVRSTTTSS